MPTKRFKPRWGHKAPGYAPNRQPLTASQVRELATLVGRTSEDHIARLSGIVADAADSLDRLRYFIDNEVSENESLAAVRDLAKLCRDLDIKLSAVDTTTRSLIARAYRDLGFSGEKHALDYAGFDRDRAAIGRLLQALVFCRGRIKVPRGSPGIGWATDYTRDAIEIYEAFTGQRFSKPRSVKARGLQAQTFVRRLVQMLDPTIPSTSIGTAMRQLRTARRGERPRENHGKRPQHGKRPV
jgi:hypothetical protein